MIHGKKSSKSNWDCTDLPFLPLDHIWLRLTEIPGKRHQMAGIRVLPGPLVPRSSHTAPGSSPPASGRDGPTAPPAHGSTFEGGPARPTPNPSTCGCFVVHCRMDLDMSAARCSPRYVLRSHTEVSGRIEPCRLNSYLGDRGHPARWVRAVSGTSGKRGGHDER